jgi:hypothetical protein
LRFRRAAVDCGAVVEYRPACGGGSCASCLAALGLDAVKQDGRWFCCPSCAQGLAPERGSEPADPKLYHRPARYFGRRRPKELRG